MFPEDDNAFFENLRREHEEEEAALAAQSKLDFQNPNTSVEIEIVFSDAMARLEHHMCAM